MISDLDDLLERAEGYAGLGRAAREYGFTELADHADGLAHRYDREYENAAQTEYLVPVDPADATNCEACQ